MKKEAFLAIFIGIVVGLGITYGIYQLRQKFTPVQPEESPSQAVIDTSPVPLATEKLFITSPQNENVLFEKEITLSGTTQSNEMVVVVVNDREYVTQADNIGAFAVKIELDSGSNIIAVTSINTSGAENKKDLVVILDPAISQTTEATASASTKPSPKSSATVKPTVKATSTPKPTP